MFFFLTENPFDSTMLCYRVNSGGGPENQIPMHACLIM